MFIWNTMLRGLAQSSKTQFAVSLYAEMETLSIKPDYYTFPYLLKACTRLCWVSAGYLMQGKVIKYGFEWNKFSRNALIYFHANCGDTQVANYLFDGSAREDSPAWSSLTASYAKRGDLVMARKVFDERPMKNLVSWNVMITAYVKQGEMERARVLFALFFDMEDDGRLIAPLTFQCQRQFYEASLKSEVVLSF